MATKFFKAQAPVIVLTVLSLCCGNSSAQSENDLPQEKCDELYKAWVYNQLLESWCNWGGMVSRKIGIVAKAGCEAKLSESRRNEMGLEVGEFTRDEFHEIGKEKFCVANRAAYVELSDLFFDVK